MFILDALSGYTPRDEREAQNICERISPRLAHANAAVVLSTVKVRKKRRNGYGNGDLAGYTVVSAQEIEDRDIFVVVFH